MAPTSPFPPHNVFLMGAGALGLGLAHTLKDGGHRIIGLWNRNEPRRTSASSALGCPGYGDLGAEARKQLAHATLVIVAVSDDAIGSVSKLLAESQALQADTIIAHTSGCLAADVLDLPQHTKRASFHPLLACPNAAQARAALPTAHFVLEGDPSACDSLAGLVSSLGATSSHIGTEHKDAYHASAVIASNLMVTLLAEACAVAEHAGMTAPLEPLKNLAVGALSATESLGIPGALTGPVVRGDEATIRRHLQALDPETRELYIALSKRAVELAKSKGLSAEQAGSLSALLSKPSDTQ